MNGECYHTDLKLNVPSGVYVHEVFPLAGHYLLLVIHWTVLLRRNTVHTPTAVLASSGATRP